MKQGEARARIDKMVAQVGVGTRRVFARVAQGDVRRLVLDQEKLVQADLIVAGKNGRSAVADFLLGSVARQLLTDSKCDVVIIPRTAAEPIGATAAHALTRRPSSHFLETA
jgi:nucleotide-binding universal stress UspA family protein